MPRSSPIQTSFNAGKWGPRLQGRVDLEKYSSACNELKNFIPTVQGPALKRSGTRFVKTVKDQSKSSRLIPFEFSTEQAYVLELYEGGMRVLKDSGAVLESGVTVANSIASNPTQINTSSPHGYSTGDEVYVTGTTMGEINGRFFTISYVAPSSFTLDGEDGTTYSAGAGGTVSRTYSLEDGVSGNSIPWLESELDSVAFVQNGDLLFLAHPNHPPHKITRTGHTEWACEEIEFAWPPFRPENDDDDILFEISENTGTGKTIYLRGGNISYTNSVASSVVTISGTPTIGTTCTVTTAAAHGYSNGDTVYIHGAGMTELNNRYFEIENVTGTTFDLVGEDSTGHTSASGGNVDKVKTDFKFTSSMIGGYFQIRQIILADLVTYPSTDVAFQNLDLRLGAAGVAGDCIESSGNVYSLHQTASSNLAADTPPVHDRKQDGTKGYYTTGAWNFYNRGAGYAKITAVASDGYSCTVDIIEDFPYACSTVNPSETARLNGLFTGQAMPRWSEGAWSSEHGYPRAVAFFEDRLWFGGTKSDPQTFWASKVGEYEDFEGIADDASASLLFTLASAEINAIEWLAGDQQLLIGTRGGEFVAGATRETEAITPSNITVRRQSKYGVKPGVQPHFVDSALLFMQRAGERLHQLSYSNESNRYVGPDLTALSDDILRPEAVELSYQAAPFRQLWARLSDGKLATLTYVSDQDVLGWAQVELGGTGVEVESVATIPHPDGDEDQIWMIVKRTIDGGTKRYIEYLEKPFNADTTYADAFFVDSGLTYSGGATTTITGLNHLEGETVKVFGDGIVQSDKTVSSGAITIDSASKVQVGLGFDARLQTMRFEAGAADGTAQGRRKRIHQIVLRVDQASEDVEYGANFDTMDSWDTGSGSTFSGDSASYMMPSGYEREGRIAIRHQAPTPFTLVALMPQLSTESR